MTVTAQSRPSLVRCLAADAATAAALTVPGFVLGPFVYVGHEKLWEYYAAPPQPLRKPILVVPGLRLELYRMQPRGRLVPGLIRQLQDQKRVVGKTGYPLRMGIADGPGASGQLR